MRIEKVKVEGFRLLQDVEIMLEENSTVVVGRNNSGKTSLTDVFNRFIGQSGACFRLADFSAASREKFCEARKLKEEGKKPEEVLAAFPTIALTLTFSYKKDAPSLGPLAPFVIDLDVSCTKALVRIEYKPTLATLHTLLDIPEPAKGMEQNAHLFRSLRDTIPKAYSVHVSAIDPTDQTNRREFEGVSALSALVQCNFIQAQRPLDHASQVDANMIGKLLSTLFKTATTPTAAAADQELAAKLKVSVEEIERSIQGDFDAMLKKLLPTMEVLGFPSLNDTELRPETSLNVEALLSDHTKVVYAGADGVHLPEGYNGLGTRNLIYMLLQLESYHKIYRAKSTRPAAHLIFIEEPEAHLHPQMQEVLINQLNIAITKLSAMYPDEPAWKVQFVITTHSPHVANAASFEAVRYFLSESSATPNVRKTKVKDFKKGMESISSDDQDFLHQYMTLTKCDLYFADKAIMVEGTTERLLMPRLCGFVDKSLEDKRKLARQYITCVEVGGAYAHIFYPLLDFLELKTLVVTDLDSTKPIEKENKKGKKIITWEKCPVVEGRRTSNAAIKDWFRPSNTENSDGWQISPDELLAKSENEKISGCRRIAYQIPEDPKAATCARSYEDALVLANPDRFEWPKEQDEATEAWDIANGLAKADTALRFAIREKEWKVPRYIEEGLMWLSEPPPPSAQVPEVQNAPVVV